MSAPDPVFVYKRGILVPPVLNENPLFTDLADAVDEVFYESGIDPAVQELLTIRQPSTIADSVLLAAQESGSLIKESDVTKQELETLILQANMLGFRFPQSDLFQLEDFKRICESVGQYYFESEGLESWQDFLGYAFNAEFKVIPTWTENYVDFYEEGDAAIGTPIYEGGTWYPTTHVFLQYDISKFPFSSSVVAQFFYTFANISLVLQRVQITQTGTSAESAQADLYLDIYSTTTITIL